MVILGTNPHTTNPTSANRSPLPMSKSSSPAPSGVASSQNVATDAGADADASSPSRSTTFVLGTRRSALALVQTQLVAEALRTLHSSPSYTFPIEAMSTVGDRNQTTPLHLLSPYSSTQPAKSLWTDELEARLIHGEMDVIVHSLKDVPTTLKDGCEIGCMLEREDPRDAFVVRAGLEYQRLEDLPDGSVVGTGSVRRVAQLRRAFPKLKFDDMRGNLNTRLAKLDSPTSIFSALILATSGLTRISLGHRITSPLGPPHLLHAVGQGALGVEIRSRDPRVREVLRGVGHWQTEWTCAAERGCLRVLEGGCSVPVGVESSLEVLELDASSTDSEVGYGEDGFVPLTGESPLLHFSGILPFSTPLPELDASSEEVKPLLIRRRARLSLTASVTSPDGTKHVVHSPDAVVVASYRGAEAWGEEVARELRRLGAGEILDEVNRVRKEREAKDLEAKRAAAAAAAAAEGDAQGDALVA